MPSMTWPPPRTPRRTWRLAPLSAFSIATCLPTSGLACTCSGRLVSHRPSCPIPVTNRDWLGSTWRRSGGFASSARKICVPISSPEVGGRAGDRAGLVLHRPPVPLGDVAPETIPPAGAIDVVIHARNRTTEELRARLVAAAGIDADSVDALLAALGGNQRPLVVVLDALDEAADPARTTAELLGPLMRAAARGARLRLLVGTRRNLLPDLLRGLERTTVVLDLDTAAYLEEADVAEYARRCLLEATPKSPYLHASAGVVTAVAKAIASAAGQAFLVARIVSRSLAGESTVAD